MESYLTIINWMLILKPPSKATNNPRWTLQKIENFSQKSNISGYQSNNSNNNNQ
jgi:hypothetical protein